MLDQRLGYHADAAAGPKPDYGIRSDAGTCGKPVIDLCQALNGFSGVASCYRIERAVEIGAEVEPVRDAASRASCDGSICVDNRER